MRFSRTPRFGNPTAADDEIDLAHQLLIGLDLRATGLTVRIAELARDAGSPGTEFADRAHLLRTESELAGLTATSAILELAVAFHEAVREDSGLITASIDRLSHLTHGGEYTYYRDMAHHMAERPLTDPSNARWLVEPATVRSRWRALVVARRRAFG